MPGGIRSSSSPGRRLPDMRAIALLFHKLFIHGRIEDRRPRRSLQIASRRCEDATGPEVGNCSKSSAMWRSPTSIRGYPSSVKRSPSPLSSKYSSSSSPYGPMERCSSPSDPYQRSSSPSSPIKRPPPSEEESQSQHLSPKSSPILTKKPPEKAMAFGGDLKKRKEIEESPVKLSQTKCAPLSTHSGSPASSTLAPWSPLRGTSGNPSSPSLLSSWAVPLSPFQKKYFQVRQHILIAVSPIIYNFALGKKPLTSVEPFPQPRGRCSC